MNERLQWHKFSWTAWETDDGLALCSMGAQGFWMRLLCMAAKEGGYVVLKGKKPATAENLAFLHRQSVADVEAWLKELEENDVFSRDGQGRIYSRRMMRDAKISRRNQQNGKKGGNPSLRKHEENSVWDNPTETDRVKAEKETEKEREIDPPIAPQGAFSLVLDDRQTVEPKRRHRQAASDEQVEQIWSLAPQIARQRSSKADVKASLSAALARGKAFSDIAAGIRAAYASAVYGGEHGKGVHRLIDKDRWESFCGPEPDRLRAVIATVPAAFDGPPALRESVARAAGEPFAIKYIDQCRWDAENRTLLAKTGFAADEIRNELRRWLVEHDVRVAIAARAQPEGAAA